MSKSCKAFKIIGKVISWAVFVILLMAAAFLLYYYVATKIYAVKGPGYEPKYSIYTIISPSMTPNIKVYDSVINVHVDRPEDIAVGDVITFVSSSILTPGMTITHRVIAITNDDDGQICYQTKGDFNNVADQACAKYSNIIGKVVFKIPQLGRVQYFLASKMGWLLCILIPALYIIGRDIMRIAKLSSIKSIASKMEEKNKVDPKKAEAERLRKEELKRKLAKESALDAKEYYREPKVKEIDKKKPKVENKSKNKKKGKNRN